MCHRLVAGFQLPWHQSALPPGRKPSVGQLAPSSAPALTDTLGTGVCTAQYTAEGSEVKQLRDLMGDLAGDVHL